MTDYIPPDNAIGYRAFSILEDGSNLINDMLVWGSGMGSPRYVFSRTQDAPSIALHNTWQSSIDTTGLYRQSTADIVSASYVYGTPQSLRGGKNDATSFLCRVFDPVFEIGEVVPIICDVFDFHESLPIRRMQITFANPTEPIFDLLLSNAIDLPVTIFEQTPFPPVQLPPGPRVKPPEIDWRDPSCAAPSEQSGEILKATLPVFTDDFQRASGTQPNASEHGYWGDSGGTPVAPTFTNLGLPMSSHYIWLEQTMSTQLQILAKVNIPTNGGYFAFGPFFGIDSGLFVADDLSTSPRLHTYPKGQVWIRYVNTDLKSAINVWPQGSPEPSGWMITAAPYRSSLITDLHVTGNSTLQRISIFAEDPPVPGPSNQFQTDVTTVGSLPMGWLHTFPFSEPFRLYWVLGNLDDGWVVGTAQDVPEWAAESSTRTNALQPHHEVAMVWSFSHLYGPYPYYAEHQTRAVTIPAHRPTGQIRVTGTVTVKADYVHSFFEDRITQTVPVTVNLDVYNYDEGEPYWLAPPYAALGRTATSVYASCRAGNGPPQSVTVPFSFDVPADMLTEIDVNGGFQWGVKVWNPEDVLRSLDPSGGPLAFTGPNAVRVSAYVNSDITYAVSYDLGGGTTYFCDPPTAVTDANQAATGYICHLVTHTGGASFTTFHNFLQGSLEVYVNGIRQFDFTSSGVDKIFTLSEALAADDYLRVCYFALSDTYGTP